MKDYERCKYEVAKIAGMANAAQNSRGAGNAVGLTSPQIAMEQGNERRRNWILRLRVHELIRAAHDAKEGEKP